MSYLIFSLGLLLSLCGAASIYFGYGVINVERGWAGVIAGATALSCGIVTIALACILRSLARLQTFLKAEKGARSAPGAYALDRAENPPQMTSRQTFGLEPADTSDAARTSAAPVQPEAATEADFSPRPGEEFDAPPERAGPVAAPEPPDAAEVSPVSIEDIRRLVAEKIKRKPLAEPEAAQAAGATERFEARRRPVVEVRSELLAETEAAPVPAAEARAAFAPKLADESHGFDVADAALDTTTHPPAGEEISREVVTETEPAMMSGAKQEEPQVRAGPQILASEDVESHVLPSQGEAPQQAVVEAASEPSRFAAPPSTEEGLAVIGRYESEGTSYVMFADGSIEAHSDRGVFHFMSMAELKAFMEAQGRDEGRVGPGGRI